MTYHHINLFSIPPPPPTPLEVACHIKMAIGPPVQEKQLFTHFKTFDPIIADLAEQCMVLPGGSSWHCASIVSGQTDEHEDRGALLFSPHKLIHQLSLNNLGYLSRCHRYHPSLLWKMEITFRKSVSSVKTQINQKCPLRFSRWVISD